MIFSFVFSRIMNEFNPWNVPNLEVFNFYCCPECDIRCDTKSHFVGHALEFHPKAKDFLPQFGFELNQDQTFVIPEDVKPICDTADEDLILSDTKNELMCDKDLIICDKKEIMCDICFSMVESIDALRDHIEINHEVKIQEFDIATVTDFESVTEDVKVDVTNIESINEETDDNQLHIIVIAILCIMIAAIIIYFHFQGKIQNPCPDYPFFLHPFGHLLKQYK